MLSARNLTVAAGSATLLDDVSLEARAGAITVIIGPNGAGKSTLLKCLTGEIRPRVGAVELHGCNVADLGAARLAELRAVLPQSGTLAFPFTVTEVVMLGLRTFPGDNAHRQRVAREALARTGMEGYAGRMFQTLSGGEQQRVQLARVLCQVWTPVRDGEARYLLLDEPISSLDIRHQIDVLELARAYARAGGGVIAVLHDLDMAADYADTLAVLQAGRLVAQGAPREVLTAPLLREVYGLTDAMLQRRWPALLSAEPA